MRRNPAVTFRDAPELGLVVDEIGDQTVTMILVRGDPRLSIEKNVIGYIWLGPIDEGTPSIVQVFQSAAEHGYGPLLYWSAMEWASRHGIWVMPDPTRLSPQAERLWRRLLAGGVTQKRLPKRLARHKMPWLNVAVRLDTPLHGYDEALRKGERFIRERALKEKLDRKELRALLLEEGSAYYHQRTRHLNPCRLKRRLLGWLR